MIIQDILADNAPLEQAPIHSKHKVHSGSLNFSQGKSRILICIGHIATQSPHLVHLEGSLFKPRKLNLIGIAISAPVGHTYLHQNHGTM